MDGWMVDCERFYGRCKTRGEMFRFDVSADMRMHAFNNSETACFMAQKQTDKHNRIVKVVVIATSYHHDSK